MASRGLRRNPAFTLAAVLSLALGIGANTAIFSFVNTLMLRMLPVEKPEQLLLSIPDRRLGRRLRFVSAVSGIPETHRPVRRRIRAQRRRAKCASTRATAIPWIMSQREYVTGNYFDVLGVKPAIGRLFKDDDNRIPQGHPLVVLSYDFWRSRMAIDPAMLGRVLKVDEQPLTVIGVAAPGFHGVEVENHADMWVPAMMSRGEIMQPGMHWVWIMARRRPEIPRSRMQAAANTIMQQYLMSVYGGQRDSAFGKWALEQKIEVRDAGVGISMLRETFGKPLTILMAAVGLVLLIACANVANLLIGARGRAPPRDCAALFVGRYALAPGAAVADREPAAGPAGQRSGPGIRRLGRALHAAVFAAGLRRTIRCRAGCDRAGIHAGHLHFLGASLFGLAPALRATSLDPAAALKDGGSQQPGPARAPDFAKRWSCCRWRFPWCWWWLAGLFAHSLAGLRSINPGFVAQNVVTFSLDYPQRWKAADKEKHRERLLARLSAVPGIAAISYGVAWTLIAAAPGALEFAFRDRRAPPRKASRSTSKASVRPTSRPSAYVRCGAGNSTPSDLRSTRKIAVVNEAFVREFFRELHDPVGRILSFDDSKPEGGEPTYIVGLVRDILHDGLKTPAKSDRLCAVSRGRRYSFDPTLLVRAQLPAAVAAADRPARDLSRIDPEVALVEPRTLRERVDDSIFVDRMIATLSGFFGAAGFVAGRHRHLRRDGLRGHAAHRGNRPAHRARRGAGPDRVDGLARRPAADRAWAVAIGLPLSFAAARLSASLLLWNQAKRSAGLRD